MYSHLWILLVGLTIVLSNEVILSAGVGRWARLSLRDQYTAYKTYRDIGLITASSILAYQLTENGTLTTHPTNDTGISGEDYQYLIKRNLGLKAIPCLFCDSTIGACGNLSVGVNNLFTKEDAFIEDTVQRAQKYGWSGYSVDFEFVDQINSTRLSQFMLKWGTKLTSLGMILSVWIGGPTEYDLDMLFNSTAVQLVTMDTYASDYYGFIQTAGNLQMLTYNISQIGLGILTYAGLTLKSDRSIKMIQNDESVQLHTTIDTDEMMKIAKWMIVTKTETFSIWAATIPPAWYNAILFYRGIVTSR